MLRFFFVSVHKQNPLSGFESFTSGLSDFEFRPTTGNRRIAWIKEKSPGAKIRVKQNGVRPYLFIALLEALSGFTSQYPMTFPVSVFSLSLSTCSPRSVPNWLLLLATIPASAKRYAMIPAAHLSVGLVALATTHSYKVTVTQLLTIMHDGIPEIARQ
jgi:hypothetical protein